MSILKRIVARLENATPITSKDVERFFDELHAEAPELARTLLPPDQVYKSSPQARNYRLPLQKVEQVFERLGWHVRDSHKGLLITKVLLIKGDVEWPVTIVGDTEGTVVQLGSNDRSENDPTSLAELKRLAKALKLPSSTTFKNKEAFWKKRGGLAGDDILRKVSNSAIAAGFKEVDYDTDGRPDGGYVGNTWVYAKESWTLTLHNWFGAIPSENSYSISLSKK